MVQESTEHVRKFSVKCAGTLVPLYFVLFWGRDIVRVRVGGSPENRPSRFFTNYPQVVEFISYSCFPATPGHCRGFSRSHDDGELPHAEHLNINNIW